MSLMSKRSTLRRFCCLLATAVVATGVGGASQAWGAFGIAGFDGAVSDSSGAAYTQAGGHPDSASVTLQLNRTTTADGSVIADGGDLREAKVELPPGLVGNPTAMPKCPKNLDLPSEDEGATGSTYEVNKFCPVNTIVGTAVVTLSWTDQEVVLGRHPSSTSSLCQASRRNSASRSSTRRSCWTRSFVATVTMGSTSLLAKPTKPGRSLEAR